MARESEASGETGWYYPLYQGIDGEVRRDKQEDEDPFRVEIEPLTGSEARALEAKHLDPRERTGLLQRSQTLEAKLFEKRVHRVEGYRVTWAGKRYAPTDGKALHAAIMAGPDSEWRVTGEDILAAVRDESKLRPDLPPSSASPSASG